jgi:copper chaperone CopZ
MKQLGITLLVAVCFATTSFSQTKAVLTAKIKTPETICEACKTRLETYLKRYDGILSVAVNYRKGETTVRYATDRINIETIKAAIANAGYDADDVAANPDAYKLLPKSCKKFEDGGGHPKPKVVAPAQ